VVGRRRHRDQLVAVEAHHDVGHRSGGHAPYDPVDPRVQGDGGHQRRRAGRGPEDVGSVGAGGLEQARAHEDVHQGQRGQRRAERLADQLEVEHGGARPDARAAQLGELAPQLRVEAERFGVADAIGRRLLGEERLEDGDQAFLVVAQGEIHGQPNTTRASPLGSTDTASPARRTSVVNRYWMTAGPYTAGPGASAWPS